MILMQACASMHIMLVAQMVLIDAPTLTHGDILVVDGKAFAIYMRPSPWHHSRMLRGEPDLSPWKTRPTYVIAFFTWDPRYIPSSGPTSFSNHHHHPTP